MTRLLVVDDDPRVVKLLHRALEKEGYEVDSCESAEDALGSTLESSYDGIILDVNLPDLMGFDVCRRLRGRGDWTPVLMLTGRGLVADRVAGLESGADDYLCKPFSIWELNARLRSLLRRSGLTPPEVIQRSGVTLDLAGHRVLKHGKEVELTRREFQLLRLLMANPGRVLSRAEILDHVWDERYEGDSNVVDVYVRYLRAKIDRPFDTDLIETVRGIGYRWSDGGAEAAS